MTEVEFLRRIRDQNIRALCGLTGSVVALIGWMSLLVMLGLSGPLWFSPAIAILAVGVWLTEAMCTKHNLHCPACEHHLNPRQNQVFVTRCCDACSHRIILDGKPRRPEAFHRLNRIQTRVVLTKILWCWPALFGFFALCAWADPVGIRK